MAKAPLALGEARLAKERALAKLRQLQSDQLESRLLDRDEVAAQWSQAFAALRDRALAMGDRISNRGASAEELRAIMDGEMRDLLAVWSRGDL